MIACNSSSIESEIYRKQAAERVDPRALLTHMHAVSAFCLIWEQMELMRFFTEVVAVSVLYWTIGQKPNMVDISHHLSLQSSSHPLTAAASWAGFTRWILVGKKKNQWWVTWLVVTSEVTGTDWAAGFLAEVCSESQEVRRSAQHYSRLHPTPPLWGGEGRRSQFICRKNHFQQCAQECSKACPHSKVNHVIKWMHLNLDRWLSVKLQKLTKAALEIKLKQLEQAKVEISFLLLHLKDVCYGIQNSSKAQL